MRNFWVRSVVFSSVLLVWGCKSDSPASSSSGGSPGSGGSSKPAGSGGATGGSAGSGGATSSGGAQSGGNTNAGGSAGSGGNTNAGGATNSGGSTNAGGSTSAGGGAGSGGSAGSNAGGSKTGGAAGSIDAGLGGVAGSNSGGNSGGGAGGSGTTPGIDGGSATGGAAGGSTGGVTVQLDATKQTMEGFGLNTALGGGSVPWDTLYGSTGSGLGFSIVRVGMNPDGSLSGSVPAKSYNAKVIGSVWTAPKTCKDNNNEQKGGHLLTSCYDSFSTTVANFAKAQGLYAMAAANEPDFASCGSTIGPPCNGDYVTMVYTAKEMVAWVKVLGPKLHALNPPVKLIAPEPSEWVHLWSNASATGSTVASHPNSSDPLGCGCFSNTATTVGCASKCASGDGYDYGHWLAKDETAWPLVDILGTHEYDSQRAEPWPADVDGGKRSKPVYQTEVSGVMYWPEQGPSNDINNGVVVAGWVHSALVVGEASAWLYWWYQPSGNDNEGLVYAGSSALTKRAYTIGNYSKFVRPGAVMVEVTGNSNANVLLSAFTGTDGTVIVAINKGTAAVSMPITIAGGTAPASCTPTVTSATDNLKAGTAVTVTEGAFTASLAGMTVTTFVCK